MPAVLGGWVPAGGDDAGTTLPRYSTDVVVASMQAQQAGHSRQGPTRGDLAHPRILPFLMQQGEQGTQQQLPSLLIARLQGRRRMDGWEGRGSSQCASKKSACINSRQMMEGPQSGARNTGVELTASTRQLPAHRQLAKVALQGLCCVAGQVTNHLAAARVSGLRR